MALAMVEAELERGGSKEVESTGPGEQEERTRAGENTHVK